MPTMTTTSCYAAFPSPVVPSVPMLFGSCSSVPTSKALTKALLSATSSERRRDHSFKTTYNHSLYPLLIFRLFLYSRCSPIFRHFASSLANTKITLLERNDQLSTYILPSSMATICMGQAFKPCPYTIFPSRPIWTSSDWFLHFPI